MRSTSTSTMRASTFRSRRSTGWPSAPSRSVGVEDVQRTGWRIGTIVAPPGATDAIRKVHDFLTVGAPARFRRPWRRDSRRWGRTTTSGWRSTTGRGGICCAAPWSTPGFVVRPPGRLLRAGGLLPACRAPDDEFSFWLDEGDRGGAVPGSSFFSRPELGRRLVRFAFCKTEEMLAEARGAPRRVRRPARPYGRSLTPLPSPQLRRGERGGEVQPRQRKQPPPAARSKPQPPLALDRCDARAGPCRDRGQQPVPATTPSRVGTLPPPLTPATAPWPEQRLPSPRRTRSTVAAARRSRGTAPPVQERQLFAPVRQLPTQGIDQVVSPVSRLRRRRTRRTMTTTGAPRSQPLRRAIAARSEARPPQNNRIVRSGRATAANAPYSNAEVESCRASVAERPHGHGRAPIEAAASASASALPLGKRAPGSLARQRSIVSARRGRQRPAHRGQRGRRIVHVAREHRHCRHGRRTQLARQREVPDHAGVSNRSLRGSTRSPSTCSGLMNSGRPDHALGPVVASEPTPRDSRSRRPARGRSPGPSGCCRASRRGAPRRGRARMPAREATSSSSRAAVS